MSYTLLIIDMQKKFYAARDKNVQESCKKYILRAIKNRASIIFIEFSNHGPTIPCLTRLVKNYDKVFFTTKNEWDGSKHSLTVMNNYKLNKNKLRVCGVFTDCCVLATVQGLVKKSPTSKIEIISSACGGISPISHNRSIAKMLKLENVKEYNK